MIAKIVTTKLQQVIGVADCHDINHLALKVDSGGKTIHSKIYESIHNT
jgi:hypothetical protein